MVRKLGVSVRYSFSFVARWIPQKSILVRFIPHPSCKISAVLTLARNPEEVRGGDHVFEGNTTIPFTHNRLILFPSIVLHEVTEVLSDEERYSITMFLDTDSTIEEESRQQVFNYYQDTKEEEAISE